MRMLWSALPAAVLLVACGDGGSGKRGLTDLGPDSVWMGEFSFRPSGSVFAPCGQIAAHYAVLGPGLDSLSKRYSALRTAPGEWVKTWIGGQLALRGSDTVLWADRYMHMEGNVFCAPVPDPEHAGSYLARFNDPSGEVSIRYDLFPDGTLLMITTANHGRKVEEMDGTWGMAHSGELIVDWGEGNDRRPFLVQEHGLLMPGRKEGSEVFYDRAGAPQRLRGAYGNVLRWMVDLSKAQGHPRTLEQMDRTTDLDSIFPTPAARLALDRAVQEVLQPRTAQHQEQWRSAATVGDLVELVRTLQRS